MRPPATIGNELYTSYSTCDTDGGIPVQVSDTCVSCVRRKSLSKQTYALQVAAGVEVGAEAAAAGKSPSCSRPLAWCRSLVPPLASCSSFHTHIDL